MDDTPIFSERYGLTPSDAPITIRNDAPDWLRTFVIELAYEIDHRPARWRSVLCGLLLESQNSGNFSEFPNIDEEVRGLLAGAEWFHVYDFIEAICYQLEHPGGFAGFGMMQNEMDQFANKLNNAFHRKGVGWQLVDGRIEIRGEESFESSVRAAIKVTEETGREVACRQLHEALSDLSKRPSPHTEGAIYHAMAALECVAKDVTGETKSTLGEWVKNNPNAFPQPIGGAIEKLWGYSSQYGRHVQEGKPADYIEAELVVGLAGALVLYLIKKAPAT
jgi:hypothetical protein